MKRPLASGTSSPSQYQQWLVRLACQLKATYIIHHDRHSQLAEPGIEYCHDALVGRESEG